MSYIQIDARGCGAGKTRNTIVPRIKNNMQMGIRTLVVVPSKDLQKEYRQHFGFDDITIVNSDTGRILEQYQTADTPVICITHQGFLQTPTDCFDKTNTDLIIDEAFNPYAMETFSTSDSAGRTWVDFSQVFEWKDAVPKNKPPVTPQPYFEISVTRSTPPDIISSEKWRKIANPNWRLFATWETGTNLIGGAGETTSIGLELCESVLDNWSSVWIAAAAFEQTFMAAWMSANRIPYETVLSFQPHKGKINWHMPTEEFRWSKGCRTANPEIEAVFRDYCNTNRTGRLIYNKNNDSVTAFPHGDKLSHNAHGINAYADRLDYAFMSAIQPSAQFSNFLYERSGLSGKELTFALSGYTVYQLIMRSALRDPTNTTPVNVFALDTEMILEVMDLFDPKTSVAYPNIPVEDSRTKTRGKAKKPAMTPAERARLFRLKQKNQTTS